MTSEILVVEDHEEWQNILRDDIEDLGYVVDIASSFEEAINIYLANKVYDVVVTDIGLSEQPDDTSGLDILAWIKKKCLRTVTLAISGRAAIRFNKEEFQRKYGVLAYVDRKSYDSDDFAALLAQAMQLSTQAANDQLQLNHNNLQEG